MGEVNATVAVQAISAKAVADGIWTRPTPPSSDEITVLAFIMTGRSVPPPQNPQAKQRWLLGCARRMGLLPWPFSDAPATEPPPPAVDFYSTLAWKRLRYKAILLYGRICMCCGRPAKPVHVDHIKPRSKYPHLALDITNVQITCNPCNLGKGAWDETDWRPIASAADIPARQTPL